MTAPGMFMGTAPYMSPEQIRGEEIDARSDLFSLGATLYEAATGALPFRGGNREEITQAILGEQPAPPRKLNPKFPRGLERIILTALEKDRGRRYQSALQLHADLTRWQSAREASSRRRWLWGGAAAAVMALAAILSVARPWGGGRRARNPARGGAAVAQSLRQSRTGPPGGWNQRSHRRRPVKTARAARDFGRFGDAVQGNPQAGAGNREGTPRGRHRGRLRDDGGSARACAAAAHPGKFGRTDLGRELRPGYARDRTGAERGGAGGGAGDAAAAYPARRSAAGQGRHGQPRGVRGVPARAGTTGPSERRKTSSGR